MAPRIFRMLTLPLVAMVAVLVPASLDAAPPATGTFSWTTVVNNNDVMPGSDRTVNGIYYGEKNFNSYNQPSVNGTGLVVLRARSKGGEGGGSGSGGTGGEGGNQPTHGIYTRDMSVPGSPIVRILDRKTSVPAPTTFNTLRTASTPPSSKPRPSRASTSGPIPLPRAATTSRYISTCCLTTPRPGWEPRGSTRTRSGG